MKNSLLIFCLLFYTAHAFGNLHIAPASFSLGQDKKAVFADFIKAEYTVLYDVEAKRAFVKSKISFKTLEKGYAIFDLVINPKNVTVNSKKTMAPTAKLPDRASTVRFIDMLLEAGNHTLELENEITSNLSFGRGIKSGFWMSDLTDRKYLEQYLPTNLEFDQYQMNLHIKITGTDLEHSLYTNGQHEKLHGNEFKITYPAYFTASSMFFHLNPKNSFKRKDFIIESVDGREIPVIIYSRNNTAWYINETKKVFKELEKDYGPWPHPKLIIYGAGSGGMEYSGATITSKRALGHELIHSYFARGVMPARGNSGWVDEAIASWRDSSYPRRRSSQLRKTKMAGHSTYKRTTDRDAYTSGAKFMGYLDGIFKDQGGMRPFLKHYREIRLFRPFLTSDFKNELRKFFNRDLTPEFDKYIYGKEGVESVAKSNLHNLYHPKLSERELLDLL